VGFPEVKILSFPWYLVLGEEMQQDTVHATARIGGYTQAVEGNFNAGILEGRICLHGTIVLTVSKGRVITRSYQ